MKSALTQARLKELVRYDHETGIFYRLPSGKLAGGVNPVIGYLQISVDGKRYYGHRLAWLYVYGEMPVMNIDHINGVKSDNRIANLRLCTQDLNGQNRGPQRNNTSGHKGVKWHKAAGKWAAAIKANGRHIHLGLFHEIMDAVNARVAAEISLHQFSPIARPACQ